MFNLFATPVYAEENPILFWGTTCPYCHIVKEEIKEQGLYEKINIEELEIYENKENLNIFREKISICGIDPSTAGVPLLFAENQCFVGVDSIIGKLKEMVGEEEIVTEVEEVEDGDVLSTTSEGKKNTEIMIFILLASMITLLVVGFVIQKKKNKEILSLVLFSFIFFSFAKPAMAMCPVCTVAVGAGLGFSRYLGIDDTITGVWIGGLFASSTMWLIGWLEKKNIKIWWSKLLAYLGMYGLLALSFYFLDVVGHPTNQLWGIDKVVLGTVLGSLIFVGFAKLHLYLKKRNGDKVFFPFQKVIFTYGSLVLLTVVFYLLVY